MESLECSGRRGASFTDHLPRVLSLDVLLQLHSAVIPTRVVRVESFIAMAVEEDLSHYKTAQLKIELCSVDIHMSFLDDLLSPIRQ
eukprot:1390054-Amphidinium_carterae.1